MFRLAHFSDVHLGPLPDATFSELVSKRITGYINWRRNRARSFRMAVIDAIVGDIARQQPDHVALTGDLVNIALHAEIELARQWLVSLPFGSDSISVVPGNHDAYVPGALASVRKAWAAWMLGDGAGPDADVAFPYLRVRANVALIGVSSARATAPFLASGFFETRQAARVAALLEETAAQGLFRVVMIHHPPVRGATGTHKRLFGIGRFQDMIASHGAELVLHGHTHLATTFRIDGPSGKESVPVIGVPAGGQAHGEGRTPAQYNLIQIGGAPGAWSVALSRRGVTGADMAVRELRQETLIQPEGKGQKKVSR